MISLSAVMFAFNEGRHIESVIRETLSVLAQHTTDHELIVVDDGSTDETPRILDGLAKAFDHLVLVRHPTNLGIGEAVHSGYERASKEYICILPADGQVTLAQYVNFFQPAIDGADLVLARYTNRAEVDVFKRMVLSNGLRLLMRFLLGVNHHIDAAFLFRRALLDEIPLTSRSFFVNLELPIRLIRAGFRVEERQMEVFPRISGSSKVVELAKINRVAMDLLRLRFRLFHEQLAGWIAQRYPTGNP